MTNLHLHTKMSLLDGLIRPKELMQKVKSLGQTAVACTDHGSVAGLVEFWKEARKVQIKPLLGCEFYHERGQVNHHLIMIARNFEGYRNLIKLNNLAQQNIYKKPRINDEMIKQHGRGLICLTACLQGYFPQTILQGRPDWAWVDAMELWCDKVYLEVQNHGIEEEAKVLDYCVKSGKPCVATTDAHYLNKEHSFAHEVALAISSHKPLGEFKFNGNGYHVLSNEEAEARFDKRLLEMSDVIAAEVEEYDISHDSWQLPNEQLDADGEFLELSSRLQEYIWNKKIQNKEEYEERLKYEFGVIKDNGFLSYFKSVGKICGFVDNELKSLRGWGRGSAGGSLVAFLYGITKVDPIRWGLFFERFLNPDRISPPDIDLDFKPEDRPKVLEFMRREFGDVYQIGTYTTLGSKDVIKNVSKAMHRETALMDFVPMEAPVPTIAELDTRDSFHRQVVKEGNEDFVEVCKVLEGLPKSMSAHASGVVIDQWGEVPVRISKSGASANIPVCAYDMYALDDIKLVKYDILGVNQLSVIDETCKAVGIKTEDIPLDDKETFENFNGGNTLGTFQFETHSYQGIIKDLKPDTFEELVSLNAIGRPGCLDSGMTNQYINRKWGRESSDKLHPKMPDIGYYNLPLFQESLMLISRDFCGFTMSEADTLRKGIGKKKKDILDELKPKFIEGAIKTSGATQALADELWSIVEKAGRYSWNLSHAVCYTLISYWTMYLSAHYPTQYFAQLLNGANAVGDTAQRRRILLTECRRRNIPVKYPNVNRSDRQYTAQDGEIYLGLCGIKFVSDAVIDTIVKERKNGAFKDSEDFYNRLPHKVCSSRVVKYLKMAGAFEEYTPTRLEEIESIGFSISGRAIDQSFRKYVQEAGEVIDIRETTTKKGDPMAFVTVDFHDEIRSVVVFPRQLAEYKPLLVKGNVLGFFCDGDVLQKIFNVEDFVGFIVEIPDEKVDEFLTFCPKCNGLPNVYCGSWAVATVNLTLEMFNFIEREFGVVRVRKR